MSEWIPSRLPPDVITVTQRMTVRNATKLMNTMNPQPSAEALGVAQWIDDERRTCPIPMGVDQMARGIDSRLQLPQRNAALLLAQQLVDSGKPYGHRHPLPDPPCDCDQCSITDELREALAAIKTKP